VKTTIVIPTYNEAENIPRLVKAIFDLNLSDVSILIVDDNSPDGTGQIAEELGRQNGGRVQVLHRPGKMGLGSAFIQGFTRALQMGADAVGQMDADFSHQPEKIAELIEALKTCDVALGSRYVEIGRAHV
jgi:dolichol-phosphate mannosyltransferase